MTCPKCGNPKPCRACEAQRKQAWAVANREKVRLQKRAYELAHPDRAAESKAACYLRNRERYLADAAIRKVINRDAINARYRQQFAQDPTPFIERNRRRQEREAAIPGVFTAHDKRVMLGKQGGKCAGCAVDISNCRFEADHIVPVILGGSHWPENRQLLCVTCNHRKGVKTPEQWQEHLNKVAV